jgi:hypothetical protein
MLTAKLLVEKIHLVPAVHTSRRPARVRDTKRPFKSFKPFNRYATFKTFIGNQRTARARRDLSDCCIVSDAYSSTT